MVKNDLLLPWGKDEIALDLPESWHVAGILEPSSLPPVSDPAGEVRRSLAQLQGERHTQPPFSTGAMR